jgi:Tol biopolymer transport system component
LLNDKIDWKLTPISTEQATGYALSWTATGKLIQKDSVNHAYVTSADGSNRIHLVEGDPLVQDAAACGPGDMIVLTLVTENNAQQVWRLNVATSELKQLTFGKLDWSASCTPDGKWVVYGESDSLQHIFKVSVDGGTPVELAHGSLLRPTVSPDGTLVAYLRKDGQGLRGKPTLVLQKIDGGPAVREIEVSSTYTLQHIRWTPDGRALAYIHDTTGNVQNVYMQPLAGGEPVQLTHFDSEPALVADYAWSKDGKKFAVTRARYNDADVVMFSGFR